jgi:hypothetical protein
MKGLRTPNAAVIHSEEASASKPASLESLGFRDGVIRLRDHHLTRFGLGVRTPQHQRRL